MRRTVDVITRARLERVKRGLRIIDVQITTGISAGVLSQAERGLMPLSPDVRAKLATLYGVRPETLDRPGDL